MDDTAPFVCGLHLKKLRGYLSDPGSGSGAKANILKRHHRRWQQFSDKLISAITPAHHCRSFVPEGPKMAKSQPSDGDVPMPDASPDLSSKTIPQFDDSLIDPALLETAAGQTEEIVIDPALFETPKHTAPPTVNLSSEGKGGGPSQTARNTRDLSNFKILDTPGEIGRPRATTHGSTPQKRPHSQGPGSYERDIERAIALSLADATSSSKQDAEYQRNLKLALAQSVYDKNENKQDTEHERNLKIAHSQSMYDNTDITDFACPRPNKRRSLTSVPPSTHNTSLPEGVRSDGGQLLSEELVFGGDPFLLKLHGLGGEPSKNDRSERPSFTSALQSRSGQNKLVKTQVTDESPKTTVRPTQYLGRDDVVSPVEQDVLQAYVDAYIDARRPKFREWPEGNGGESGLYFVTQLPEYAPNLAELQKVVVKWLMCQTGLLPSLRRLFRIGNLSHFVQKGTQKDHSYIVQTSNEARIAFKKSVEGVATEVIDYLHWEIVGKFKERSKEKWDCGGIMEIMDGVAQDFTAECERISRSMQRFRKMLAVRDGGVYKAQQEDPCAEVLGVYAEDIQELLTVDDGHKKAK